MGVQSTDAIQEIGWDEDCDSTVSESLEDAIGEALHDQDSHDIVDLVLLWWRQEDGDVVDGLVDASRNLGTNGRIWLLTPVGAGSIEPGVVAESAQLAGMVPTKSARIGDWQGACLVPSGLSGRAGS